MDEEEATSQTQEEEAPVDQSSTDEQPQEEKPAKAEEPSKEEPEEVVEEEGEQTEETPEPELSPRQEKRVEQINELKLNNILKKVTQQEQTRPDTYKGIDYKETISADEQVYETLTRDREQYGKSLQNEALEQTKSIQFHTRLEIDAPKVASKYDMFDPESPNFKPAQAAAINEMYLATVGYDPKTDRVANNNVRYSEYVDGIMELVETTASSKVQESVKNVTKQASQTGIRPGGTTSKKKSNSTIPHEMSDEELDSVISRGLGLK